LVKELLWQGKEKAICTQDLLLLTGLKSPRILQNMIERERLQGGLILSTSQRGGGYFLPDEGEKGIAEMQEYERTLKARALNTLRTLKAVRIALKEAEHGNQTKLFYHQEDRSDDDENL